MLKLKVKIVSVILLILLLPTVTFASSIKVYFSLVDDPEGAIIEELDKAEESIDIAMYYFTDRDLANALIDAHNRGVKIRVYLDKDQLEAKYSKSRYLAKHGISIRYSDNPYIMHHKFCVIDNEVITTGSYNWTASAGERNNENLLVIRDPPLANRFEEEFNRLWNKHYLIEKSLESPIQEIKPFEQKPQTEKIVYITKTGKKYHRASCRYLIRSMIPITLSEAIAREYTPCSVCKPDPPIESSEQTEREISSEKAKEVLYENENSFWNTNFKEFLKLYQLKKTELARQEFEKWIKECVGKKVKWAGLIQKLEHSGNEGAYIVEIQTHLGIDIEEKIREEPYGWKVVAEVPGWESDRVKGLGIDQKITVVGTINSIYSREVRLQNVLFVKSEKLKAGEEEYGYFLPLGNISILGTGVPLILDKRSGKVWALMIDPKTEEATAEYFGSIEEILKEKEVKPERSEKMRETNEEGKALKLQEGIYSTDFSQFCAEYEKNKKLLTEVQFEEWRQSLMGKKVRWKGEIKEVKEYDGITYYGMPYNYKVLMDLGPGGGYMGKYDVIAYFSKEDKDKVLNLKKNQKVEFIATIADVGVYSGGITVEVKDVEFIQ